MKTKSTPLLIVISAPSGGGKTTLCQQLLAHHPEMTRAITCTTRAPRPGERHGIDYHFLTPEAFLKKVKSGHFLEHAIVYGNHYGTLKSSVLGHLKQGRDVLLNIDVQGATTVGRKARRDPLLKRALVSVFLTPASLGDLEARLKKRATDGPAELRKRLGVARKEIARWREFEYLIVSTTIEEDARRMECIVEAERMSRKRARLA